MRYLPFSQLRRPDRFPAGDTLCRASQHSIFPQLGGASVPSSLPFAVSRPLARLEKSLTTGAQVHFLCGDTFDGAHAFPSTDTQAPAQRDDLLAASLLDSSDAYVDGRSARARAMGAKIRLAGDLRARRREEGCPECEKAVKLR